MPYKFTDEELSFFKKNGFLILPLSKHKLFDPEVLYKWAYEIKNWPKEKGKWMAYDEINSEGERQMMKVEYFSHWHDGMSHLMREGDIPDLMSQLSGNEMCLFKEKINYKAPKGNGFSAHMDAPSYDDVAKVEHLTCNIAVDPANLENGCLEVVPGSQKMEFVPHPEEVKKHKVAVSNIDPKWEAEHEWVPAVLAPGDILFFGSHVAHRSGANNSNKSRAAVYATYCGTENNGRANYDAYYGKRRQLYPPEYEWEEGKDYTDGINLYAPAGADVRPHQAKSLAQKEIVV